MRQRCFYVDWAANCCFYYHCSKPPDSAKFDMNQRKCLQNKVFLTTNAKLALFRTFTRFSAATLVWLIIMLIKTIYLVTKLLRAFWIVNWRRGCIRLIDGWKRWLTNVICLPFNLGRPNCIYETAVACEDWINWTLLILQSCRYWNFGNNAPWRNWEVLDVGQLRYGWIRWAFFGVNIHRDGHRYGYTLYKKLRWCMEQWTCFCWQGCFSRQFVDVTVDEYGVSEAVPGLGVSNQVRHSPRRVGCVIFHFFVLVAVDKTSVHLGVPLITGTFALEFPFAIGSAFENLATSLDIRLQHDSHRISRSPWNRPQDGKPFGVIVRIQAGSDAQLP